jgi:hypothetical protein
VATANAERVHALATELGVSGLTADLEFPFLAELLALATSFAALVARIARDTWLMRS